MCIFWEFDKIVFSIFLFIKCMKVLGKIYFINNIIWIRKYKYGIYVIYNNINFSISLMNNIKRDKFFLILLISESFFFKLIYFIFMFFVFLYGFFFIERVLGS